MKIIKQMKYFKFNAYGLRQSIRVRIVNSLKKLKYSKESDFLTKVKFFRKFSSIIKDTSGLTLFEVIVSIAVSSLILIMVYSSHRSITKAAYQLTGIADFYENVNLTLRRIDKDITCIFFNKDNKNIGFISKGNYEYPFAGKLALITTDRQDLSMLNDIKRSYPKSDIKEVGYFLKQDDKIHDLFFLIRREESHYNEDIETGGEDNIILENVVDIKFEFRKGNDWTTNWDSKETNTIPKFVKTTLKVRNYNKEDEEFVQVSKIGIDK